MTVKGVQSEANNHSAAVHVPLRILLVEDHDDSREVFSRLLSLAGHHVTTAKTCEEALKLGNNGLQYDLLIADIELPDGNGCDLLARVAAHKGITLSGHSMLADHDRSKAAGFSMHLVKPIAMAEVKHAINEVMNRH